MPSPGGREEAALRDDPEVESGFDSHEVLRRLGELMRQMRSEAAMSQTALQAASGVDQADISRLESGALERGPGLLTLVKLAHAAGKRLVIGLEDPGQADRSTARVLHL